MNHRPLKITPVELRALAKEVKDRDLTFVDDYGFEMRRRALSSIEHDAIARGLLLLAVLMDDQLDA
jgi:hypothetical protein